MKKSVLVLTFISVLISSCAEVVIFSAGVIVGGGLGYYAGKEGYSIKVEKEEK